MSDSSSLTSWAPAPRAILRVDQVLEGGGSMPLQSLDFAGGERLESKIGERRAAPLRQGLAKPLNSMLSPRLATLGHELLEPAEVDLLGSHFEQVTAGTTRDHSSLPRTLRSCDTLLRRVCRRPRCRLAPQPVNQHVLGEDLAGPKQQHCEERALLSPAKLDSLPGVPDLERPEDPEVDDKPVVTPMRTDEQC